MIRMSFDINFDFVLREKAKNSLCDDERLCWVFRHEFVESYFF